MQSWQRLGSHRTTISTLIGLVIGLGSVSAPAQELPPLSLGELKCQSRAFDATADYVNDVFNARQDCFDRVTREVLPQTVDCSARLDIGTNDDETDDRVGVAEGRLARRITTKCLGITLESLGFPGFCEDPDGPPFTAFDHEQCIVDGANELIDFLLDVEHPPFPGTLSAEDRACQDTLARKASRMFVNELKARSECEQRRLERTIPLLTDCRAELDPLQPATGDARTDTNIVEAHNKVLRGLANECGRADLDTLGFPHLCPAPPGLIFSISELGECMYNSHHQEMIRFLDVINPVATQCGDGEVDFTEECDDGNTEFLRGEFCREHCTAITVCGDVDDSGRADLGDALFILRVATDLETCALELCDLNSDGRVNATDVLVLLSHLAGLGAVLNCPAI